MERQRKNRFVDHHHHHHRSKILRKVRRTFGDVRKPMYMLKVAFGLQIVESNSTRKIANICFICPGWIIYITSLYMLIDYVIKQPWFGLEETVLVIVLSVEFFVLLINTFFELYYRHETSEAWHLWEQADKSVKKLWITINDRHSVRAQLWMNATWVLFCIGINGVSFLWLGAKVPLLTNISLIIVLPHGLHMNTLLEFCYILIIANIKFRFGTLNSNLEWLLTRHVEAGFYCEFQNGGIGRIRAFTVQPGISYDRTTKEMIRLIKQLHLEYNKLAKRFTHIHAIKLITTSISTFVMITGLLYMLYLIVFKRHDFYDAKIFILLIWLAQNFTKLYLLNFECSTTSAEFLRTREIIHNLEIVTQDTELQQEIHQFSMQILQTDLIFEPYGLFAAGYDLLRAMGESILTLVVILIQYSPDIKSN